jgi:hypothetical protein
MTASRESDMRWPSRAPAGLAAVVLSALAFAACNGGAPDEAGDARVDSAVRFDGERREVAATLEAFEHAVLADDVQRICGRLLRVRESRDPDNDNGGQRFCVADPANDPARELRRAGGKEHYDLIVRRVDLRPLGRLTEPVRRAAARVVVGARSETFLLSDRAKRWEIDARRFGEPSRGLGRHGFAIGCRAHATVSVFTSLPRNARDPREAVTEGPFGDGIRRVLSRGASLSLAGVAYAPDYRHTYVLRDPDNRTRRAFPVTVFRAGSFDASEAVICNRRDAERIGHGGPRTSRLLLQAKEH